MLLFIYPRIFFERNLSHLLFDTQNSIIYVLYLISGIKVPV